MGFFFQIIYCWGEVWVALGEYSGGTDLGGLVGDWLGLIAQVAATCGCKVGLHYFAYRLWLLFVTTFVLRIFLGEVSIKIRKNGKRCGQALVTTEREKPSRGSPRYSTFGYYT
jgi:hypothetical protein